MYIQYPYSMSAKDVKHVTVAEYSEFKKSNVLYSTNNYHELAKKNKTKKIRYIYKNKNQNWVFLSNESFSDKYTMTSNSIIVDIILPSKTFEQTKYKLLTNIVINGVTVPKGFITDGATTPRLLWSLFPPTGRYFLAAVLHDYLLNKDVCWKEANKEFKKALLAYKVKKPIVYILYWSVQIYQMIKREIFKVKGNSCK